MISWRRLVIPYRTARGQVLPIMAALMALLVIVALFFFNITMYESNARNASANSLRLTGLVLLQQVDPAAAFERWRIEPVTAMALARELVNENLDGNPVISPASYQGLFADDLDDVLSDTGGTAGATRTGLDIEIINPAERSGQESQTYLNDPNVNVADSCTSGIFPEQVRSSITDECYEHPTVVLRLILPVSQLTGNQNFITEIVVLSMGTDV